MADKINAKEYNLWDLLSGDFIFNIPDYQRPYSWTENEALTLWDDLVEFWEESAKDPERTYFTGSIVLVKAVDSPRSEVIDGQQRLTTLSIILAVLAEYCKSYKNDVKKCLWEEGIQHKHIEGRARLILRKRDAGFFAKYIANNNISELLELDPKQLDDDSQRLIQTNAKLISERADALFATATMNVDSFVAALFNQCFFVVVTTPDNESAFRVFSVLNNRGLSLLPSDIIKARIIGEIPEDSRAYYTDKWEDIEVGLGRESFNALLSHVRMIYAKAKLHGTLVSEFEKYILSECKDKAYVITDIIEPYARAYRIILKEEYASSVGAEEVNEYLSWLNKVDDSDWMPMVMSAMSKVKDPEFISDFVIRTERLASFMYITSKTSNQRIERYSKVLACLENGLYSEALDMLNLSAEEEDAFIEALKGDIYLLPARKRSFVVMRLDRFLSDKAAMYKSAIFSIEHVMPQNPKTGSQWLKDWPDEKTRAYWTHKLANLIPLTRKKNSQAQNYDFVIKKEKYFSDKNGVTSYALAVDVLNTKEWTPEIVIARQERLIAIFAKYWQLLNLKADDKAVKNEVGKKVLQEPVEVLLQRNLMKRIDEFFVQNPSTLLPRLPENDCKVGKYVQTAVDSLSKSDYVLSEETIQKLCTIEGSRKYTHRNLPFFVPVDEADLESNMMKRYWKTKSLIETFNGKEYYVYSQWYPVSKVSKDAHLSDFLQLYLDIALNNI